jgi:transposase
VLRPTRGPGFPPHTPPKLSPDEQARVLARVHAGEPYRAIAATLGVSYQTIYRLVQALRRGGA